MLETQNVSQRNGRINIVLQHKQNKNTHQIKDKYIAKNPFNHIDDKFSSFVGLSKLKQTVNEIYAILTINKKRQEMGLATTKQVLHMLFKGNPGTGKTSVARQLAKIYYDMEVLSKGHFIEAEQAEIGRAS